MTTVEAIAGALQLLEPHGSEIFTALTKPLHKMVEIQVMQAHCELVNLSKWMLSQPQELFFCATGEA